MRRRVGNRGRFAARRHAVAPRWEVRTKHKLALETAGLEAAVSLAHLVEGDPLGDARADGASRQKPEQPLQVLLEPAEMSRPHRIDRVEAGPLPPGQQPPE